MTPVPVGPEDVRAATAADADVVLELARVLAVTFDVEAAAFERRVAGQGGRLVALATTRAHAFDRALGYDDHATYFRKLR